MRKFQQYLFGRKVTLLTDHQPITLLFGPKLGIPSIYSSIAPLTKIWAILQYNCQHTSVKSNTGPPSRMQIQMHYLDYGTRSRVTAGILTRKPIEEEEINKLQVARVPMERFHSRDQQPFKIEFNSRRISVVHHHGWPPFLCLSSPT